MHGCPKLYTHLANNVQQRELTILNTLYTLVVVHFNYFGMIHENNTIRKSGFHHVTTAKLS